MQIHDESHLNELSNFLVALGYVSTVVDSAYEIVEQLNALQKLASNQTEFLTQREEERVSIVTNLQNEEERKNEISIEAEEFAEEDSADEEIITIQFSNMADEDGESDWLVVVIVLLTGLVLYGGYKTARKGSSGRF